jgi:hypothetical protein
MAHMRVRPWIAGGLLSAAVLAGCGASSHGATTSTAAGGPGAASAASAGNRLRAGATPALRAVAGRALAAQDLAGFAPRGHRVIGTDPTSWVVESELPPSKQAREAARLHRLGFIAGLRERLIATDGSPAEGISVVEQFPSPHAAHSELAAQIALARAAGPASAFNVRGIPGAAGFDDSHGGSSGENVAFTKGSYYYLVGAGWLTGTPATPTHASLIAAAHRLYDRVSA